MMKLNLTQKNVLENTLGKLFRDEHISIYTIEENFGIETPEKYGVNWSAQGTQAVEVARDYAEKLVQAAKVADALNKLEIVVDWESRPGIISHMKETCKEVFCPSFTEILGRGECTSIKTALELFDECYCNKEV